MNYFLIIAVILFIIFFILSLLTQKKGKRRSVIDMNLAVRYYNDIADNYNSVIDKINRNTDKINSLYFTQEDVLELIFVSGQINFLLSEMKSVISDMQSELYAGRLDNFPRLLDIASACLNDLDRLAVIEDGLSYKGMTEEEFKEYTERAKAFQENFTDYHTVNETKHFFAGCQTKEEFEKRYKELCKQLHPDNGGDADEFIKMTEEYNRFK